MLIVQLSDLHVGGTDVADYYRLDTLLCLSRAVDRINALDPLPDLCLVTGDLVENGMAAEYTMARSVLERLTMPWHPIPGNHDEHAAFLDAFADRLPTGRMQGFVQYRIATDGIDCLLLDSVVPGKPYGRLCDQRFAWLEAELNRHTVPTVLALHHPPFVTGQAHIDAMCLMEAQALAACVARHRHVEAIVCGHVHRAIHGRVAHAPACSAPSTAHQIALGLHGRDELFFTHEPPGVLLHRWSGPGTWTTLTLSFGGDGTRYAYA